MEPEITSPQNSVGMLFDLIILKLIIRVMKKVLYTFVLFTIILASCEIHPDAFFTVDKVNAFIGEDIYFTNGSYNSVEYEWDFGDGYISSAVNPVHSYSASGTYEVSLTAYSKTGSYDMAYQTITVTSPTILQIEVL